MHLCLLQIGLKKLPILLETGNEVSCKSLEVEEVTVSRALVDTLALGLCVSNVADKTVIVYTDVACASVDNRFKKLCRSRFEDSLVGIGFIHHTGHLEEAASRNCSGGRVSGLVTVNKIIVPIGNAVIGKVVKHEVSNVLMYFLDKSFLLIRIGDREAVNTPRVTA